jgi:DNA-binding transcriptional regulator YdaS (Cro superfamily)
MIKTKMLSEEQRKESLQSINAAVTLLGGPTKTARAIGMCTWHVAQWKRGRALINPIAVALIYDACLKINTKSYLDKLGISRELMRPDIFFNYD